MQIIWSDNKSQLIYAVFQPSGDNKNTHTHIHAVTASYKGILASKWAIIIYCHFGRVVFLKQFSLEIAACHRHLFSHIFQQDFPLDPAANQLWIIVILFKQPWHWNRLKFCVRLCCVLLFLNDSGKEWKLFLQMRNLFGKCNVRL